MEDATHRPGRAMHEAFIANPETDSQVAEAKMRLQSLTLTDYCPRPSFGQSGRPLTVLANMFQARFKGGTGKTIYHYDVEIDPMIKVTSQKKPVSLLRACWERLGDHIGGEPRQAWADGAYDGRKNFFTPTKFPIPGEMGTKQSVVITLPDEDEKPAVPTPAPSQTGGPSGSDEDPNGPRRFRITIKHVATIELESLARFCRGEQQSSQAEAMMLTALMSVNVLLRDDPTRKFTPVGSAGTRFFGMEGAVPIPDGGVVGKGFMQSFRPGQGMPGIQLDTAYSAFSETGPLIEVAKAILGRGGGGFRGRGGFRGGPPRGGFGGGYGGDMGGPPDAGGLESLDQIDIAKLKRVLRMAKFKITHRASNRQYTIMSITLQSASEIRFTLTGKNGAPDEPMNIAQYYKKMYGKDLRFPRLPCIQYGKKNYVPFEFVSIEPFNSLPPTKLSSVQTAEMIKISARPPPERRDNIMRWRQTLAWERLEKLQAWGLEVRDQMTEVEARVLEPPAVQYAGAPVRPMAGAWNLRGKRFVRPNKPLAAWSVISFAREIDDMGMKRFITFLCQVLRANGTTVANDRPPVIGPWNPMGSDRVIEGLRNAAKEAFEAGNKEMAPQLIVVIIPSREIAFYENIKRLAATQLLKPVVTQCLQAAKLRNDRGLDQYCSNVAMKIHSKLGGVTHCIPTNQLPGFGPRSMIIGSDVTHPPMRPGADSIAPSIACTVSTSDPENNKYCGSIRLQEGRSEVTQGLESMMVQHFNEFRENTGNLPETIVFYRDGVSEGQYATIVQQELKAIRTAAESVEAGFKPKLTFIIAAKRHNMRFFAKDLRDVDRSGNLPAGTVVDRTVTHPFAFDFYLQAHAGLVGTARPTHYLVLVDESGFGPDDLQRLTNGLCYNYARATRAVSLVPVAYYADIICTQARAFIYEDNDDSAPSESSGGRTGNSGRGMPTQAFDPMRIADILARNPEFTKVQWFM